LDIFWRIALGKHRYALYDARNNKIISVTDLLERSPEPVIANGVASYHIEDDAPVGPDVPEVELVPPSHAIWHTKRIGKR
jgi:hypothetical protein